MGRGLTLDGIIELAETPGVVRDPTNWRLDDPRRTDIPPELVVHARLSLDNPADTRS